MCMGCWAEYGAPYVLNDRTIACAKAIAAVYGESCAGGNLHCAVDDWNIDDSDIQSNLSQCEAGETYDPSRPWTAAETLCIKLMAALPLDERASALAMHDGFDPEEGLEYVKALAEE